MTETAPILIMSSERSGSNLLRTLLSNHSGVSGPVAPQFLNIFRRYIGDFEPLSERENGVALMETMLQVANHQAFGWGLEVEACQLAEREPPKDLLDAAHALYQAHQVADGARRFICKENRLFEHGSQWIDRFVDTKILYLVRDPRDYVLSWQKAPILNNTPHEAACVWRDEQQACFAMERRFPGQVLRVRYEDLVQNPPEVMTGVLEYLNEPVESVCFEVQGSKNKGQAWSSFWKNLTKPVQSANFEKFRGAFKPRTLEMIETLCAKEMTEVGYEADTGQAWRRGPWFEFRERRMSARNHERLMREHASTVAILKDRDRLVNELMEQRRNSRKGTAVGQTSP